MTHRTQKTRTLPTRTRKLNLEALEPRICLTTYTSIELAPLPGDTRAYARGLNDNGLVVGYSTGDGWQAVVWSVNPTGEVSDPFHLPGGELAHEVSNQGMIAGSGTNGKAVIWTGAFPSYDVHELGPLAGFTSSVARSISEPDSNGNVWVVGKSGASSDHHATLWQVDVNGTVLSMTDLEPDLEDLELYSGAHDVKVIGDSVFVAGYFRFYIDGDPPVLVGQGAVWETDLNGAVVGRTDLGTAEYSTLQANALNNDGDVAGLGRVLGGGKTPFLYERDLDLITDLGTLGDWTSEAHGINDDDVVVGYYGTQMGPQAGNIGGIEDDAFVWENGTMHKLHDLVSDRTFRKFLYAYDVNNYGEIVGYGGVGTPSKMQGRGFLARPEGGQHAPVASDDSYITPPETELSVAAPGVLGNDTDADEDPLTAVLQTDVSNGTLTLNTDGSFVYTPASQYSGTDSFTYLANDGTRDSNVATVTINVTETGPVTYSSTDVPLTIADPHPKKGPRDTESLLPISETAATLGMLNVDVSISHPTLSDLTLSLTSPQGLQKLLAYDGAEWNLATSTEFWGQSLDGTWVLTASDTVDDGVTGTLQSWSITVSTLSGPGVTVTPTSGLATSEAGGTASFMVILNSQPTGMVRVNLIPNDLSEGRLEQANSDDVTLIFGTSNWDEPQIVDVIGVDDTLADGDISYTIITIISDSDDSAYWIIDPDDVSMVNLDDGDGPAPLLADLHGFDVAATITPVEVQQVTSQALALWSSGLGMPVSNNIQVRIADLASGRLAEAYRQTIVVDANANGRGWFVDPTPWEHSEFTGVASRAFGHVDLLTVVTHEIGHVLGYEHSVDPYDVMAATLPIGTRRLPGVDEVAFEPLRVALLLPFEPTITRNIETPLAIRPTTAESLDSEVEINFDLFLAPIVMDRAQQLTSSPEAIEVRIYDDILDAETELIEEGLLDLLLG